MRLLPRLVFFLGLVWIGAILFRDAQAANSQPEVDATQVVMLFGGVILIGAIAGIIFVVSFLPTIGDMIGDFFFQPGGASEAEPHAAALSAVAQGDYLRAVEEYRKVVKKEPGDVIAYSEIARLSCEHNDDPATAAQALEQALQHEWPPDDAAFLSARLVDVYWEYQHDARRAKAMLGHMIETMAGTHHAANARHRLEEIEQKMLGG